MPKTYNDIYFSVRNKLRESGVEAFSLEARILLAAAAGKQRSSSCAICISTHRPKSKNGRTA